MSGVSGPGQSEGPSAGTRVLEARAWQVDSRYFWLSVGILMLGILLRFLFLESDHAYRLYWGHVIDEGRWTEQARRVVLFRGLGFDGFTSRAHLVLAPAYQAITALFFFVLGVGFTSARLVSALSGSALIIAAFLLMRPHLSHVGLFFATLILALQPDLLVLSRIAIPETPALFFESLAFFVLVTPSFSNRRALCAGLLTAAAISMKGTAALVLPVFALVAWVTADTGRSARFRRLMAYSAGVLTPALAVAIPMLLLIDTPEIGGLMPFLGRFLSFMEPEDLWGAIATVTQGPRRVPVNVLVAVAWLLGGLLGMLGAGGGRVIRSVYFGSGIWSAGYLILSLTMDYFPERYLFHVFVPLGVNIGAGLTLLGTATEGITTFARLSELGRSRAVFLALWISVPLAALLAPLIASVVADPESGGYRFRHQLPVVFLGVLALAAGLRIHGLGGRLALIYIQLPLLALPLWVLGTTLGIVDRRYWAPAGPATALGWLAILSVAAGITVLLRSVRAPAAGKTYILCFAALLATPWLIQTAPRALSPTYTVAETSRAIAQTIDSRAVVGSRLTGSLFLGNTLDYSEAWGCGDASDTCVEDPDELPGFMVSLGALPEQLAAFYDLSDRYDLNMGETDLMDPFEPNIQIHRRSR